MARIRKSRFWLQQQSKSRRGAILILGAFMMIVFCGFAAFAIDLGYIALTQAQLQNTADASALAAVLELKDADANATQAGLRAQAVAEAIYAASLNKAGGRFVELREEDILFGNRHFDNGGFTTNWEGGYAPDGSVLPGDIGNLPRNAIQVAIHYDENTGNRRELDLWFARLIGKKTAAVSGFSRGHLTPRDLVFVLDISNSMNNDSENFSGRDTIIRKLLNYPSGDYYGNTGGSSTTEPRIEVDLYFRGNSSNDGYGRLAANTVMPSFTGGNVPAVIVDSLTSGGAATAHNLIDGDVVTLRNSAIANIGYYVRRITDTRFALLNATITAASNMRWFPEAAYPSVGNPGKIRVRCNHAHGLSDGIEIRVVRCDMAGPDEPEGRSWIEVVDEERLDLLDRDINVADWNTHGLHRCYDDRRHYYRFEEWAAWEGPYKFLWMRSLDLDGPEIRGRGTNNDSMWIDADKAELFARLDFATYEEDTTYPDGTDYNHPEYKNGQSSGDKYDYDRGHPWLDWKWKTYCDWTYIDPDAELYNNKNIITTAASGPDRFGLQRYLRFLMYNGYLPALRGQEVFGRDMDGDNVFDVFPPPDDQAGESYADYPGL